MNFLAATGGWVLDVVFFAVILIALTIGVWRGFIKGICKIAGTVFAIVFSVCFCVPMENSLESTFGMTTALSNAIGATAGGWIAVVLSFLILVVIIKLGAWLLGKLGTALVNRFAPLKTVNKLLGGLLGLVKALVLILLLLAVLKWIGLASVDEFIASSSIVKHIYQWNWFARAMQFPV